MANGFRLSGTYFVCKAGNDANAGWDSDRPRKNLWALNAANATIIGAGVYNAVDISGTSLNRQLIGDGYVHIRPSTGGVLAINGGSTTFVNLTLERVNVSPSLVGNITAQVVDCRIIGCTGFSANTSTARSRVFARCVLINCDVGAVQYGMCRFNNCVAINSTCRIHGDGFVTYNSYFDFTSRVIVGNGNAGSDRILPTDFIYNNLQGTIAFQAAAVNYYFAIQDQLVGTPQANGYAVGVNWLTEANLSAIGYTGTIVGWDAAVATCINRAPLFIDAANGNYFNSASSPHVARGSAGYDDIGLPGVYNPVANADNGNPDGVIVIPSASIDTTDPDNFKLLSGQAEGYIDYIFPCYGKTMSTVSLRTLLEVNTDVAPGTAGNQLVPDAQPTTVEYPAVTAASVTSVNLNEVTVPENLIDVGDFILVNGSIREVLSKVNSAPNDVLTVNANLGVLVASTTAVSYGTQVQCASLVPNRLTYLMRTRTDALAPTIPMVDAEWDNEVDPAYGVAGQFFNQEHNSVPGLAILSGRVLGAFDVETPGDIITRNCAPQWANIRFYIRNNYLSKGQ